MASNVVAQAQSLFRSGHQQKGLETLGDAASRNDPEALTYLANICLAGSLVRRDLPLARELFRRAAAAGGAAGAAAYRAFVANGTGGPADWGEAVRLLGQAAQNDPQAESELEIIAAMRLSETGDPLDIYAGRPVSESPEAFLFPSLFSETECNFLIETALPMFEPSKVVDPQTGQQRSDPVRTSDAAAFPLVAENTAIHALCRRMAAASGTQANQGEPLQVLRYRTGQEYRPHFDAINNAENQRVLTFLVYLNDEYKGGETCFLKTGLKVKGRKGDGLLFRNAGRDGRPDVNSQHAGLPVSAGEKILASRWIRERSLGPF